MGLVANRAAGRMQARETYRTMARMERRRSFVQGNMGMRQDFGRQEQPAETTSVPAASPEPEYMRELEQLSQLRDQGIITNEDFEAKKKQILGI